MQYGAVRSHTAWTALSQWPIERTSIEQCTCTLQVQCTLQEICALMLRLTLNTAREQYSCEWIHSVQRPSTVSMWLHLSYTLHVYSILVYIYSVKWTWKEQCRCAASLWVILAYTARSQRSTQKAQSAYCSPAAVLSALKMHIARPQYPYSVHCRYAMN